MALVKVPEQGQSIAGAPAIRDFLAARGLDCVQAGLPPGSADGAAGMTADARLAYDGETIDDPKARGGYTTADVIDVTAQTPDRDFQPVCFGPACVRPAIAALSSSHS